MYPFEETVWHLRKKCPWRSHTLVRNNIVLNKTVHSSSSLRLYTLLLSLRTFFLKCHTLSPKGYILQNRYIPYPNYKSRLWIYIYICVNQWLGSKTIFHRSGSHLPPSFGSGSYLNCKMFRIQFPIRPIKIYYFTLLMI
jgi:hypothetical protein